MSKVSLQVQYDNKISQLRGLIEVEAKKLQDVIEAKDSALLEVRNLGERKAALNKTIGELEEKIKEKQNELDQIIKRELSFVSNIAKELVKEKNSLSEVKETLKVTNAKLSEATIASAEVDNFIKKGSKARILYLEAEQKFKLSEKQYLEFKNKTNEERESLETKNRELDAYKEYIRDLYGKLASYVTVTKETVEYVNELLKKSSVPINFGLPPGEIMEIDFDNFNIKRTDT